MQVRMWGVPTTKRARSLATGGLALVVGCATTSTAPLPVLSPAIEDVDVRLSEPAPGAQLIGPVEASHGSGCGAFGESGTEQGALENLKIAAFKRGANYVQVKDRTPPHPTEFCFDQRYRISGFAYRTGSNVATVESAAQPRPAEGKP